jgi:hypothetical protein
MASPADVMNGEEELPAGSSPECRRPAGLRHAMPEVNTRPAGDYLTRARHNI